METIPNRHDTIWCQLAVIAQRAGCCSATDVTVYCRRAGSEGDSFRTVCLASLGRHLLASLRTGEWKEEPSLRFKSKRGSVLPLFLYDAFKHVFSDEGVLKASVMTEVAVGHLRQLTTVFSKLPTPYAKHLDEEVQARFIANEAFISGNPGLLEDFKLSSHTLPLGGVIKGSTIIDGASRLIARILCDSDPRDINPRHGSGASACGTRPWERYGSFRYCTKIDKIWSYSDYFFSGSGHLSDNLEELESCAPLPRQAKGVLVPKDYRGGRLISEEPRELTYIQQGLMTRLVDTLQRHRLTRGYVNFTDQSINQQLARVGSIYFDPARSSGGSAVIDGAVLGLEFCISDDVCSLATLDLKDASDLLRWDLVKTVFPTHWVDALDACRSTSTRLPNGAVVELNKHAPMGSSVCFPVMALVIWSLIKAAHPASPVWVYGDDVIVPTRIAGLAIEVLQGVGLKVNVEKSFAGPTPFRESCGREYYNGSDVTPVKLGSTMLSDLDAMSSYISFVNNMTRKYGVYQNSHMIEHASKLCDVPIVGRDAQLLGTRPLTFDTADCGEKPTGSIRAFCLDGPDYLCNLGNLKRRWNADLQRFEYRLRVSRSVDVNVNTSSWSYVLRFLLQGGDTGSTNRCALARRVRYKYSWVHLSDKQM